MTWTVLERRERQEHGDLVLVLVVERHGEQRELVGVSGKTWSQAEVGKPIVLEREPAALVSLEVECVYTRQTVVEQGGKGPKTAYFLQLRSFAGVRTPTCTISRELYEVMVSRGVRVV